MRNRQVMEWYKGHYRELPYKWMMKVRVINRNRYQSESGQGVGFLEVISYTCNESHVLHASTADSTEDIPNKANRMELTTRESEAHQRLGFTTGSWSRLFESSLKCCMNFAGEGNEFKIWRAIPNPEVDIWRESRVCKHRDRIRAEYTSFEEMVNEGRGNLDFGCGR